MKSFTLTLQEGGWYGALTDEQSGDSIPLRVERPTPATVVLHLDLPPSESRSAALDRTIALMGADLWTAPVISHAEDFTHPMTVAAITACAICTNPE